jgi:hypothetical protein
MSKSVTRRGKLLELLPNLRYLYRINHIPKGWGWSLVGECLPNSLKAQSLFSTTSKKKKKKIITKHVTYRLMSMICKEFLQINEKKTKWHTAN